MRVVIITIKVIREPRAVCPNVLALAMAALFGATGAQAAPPLQP